ADLRLAVQRLISSSIVMLMSVISTHYDLSRISVGHYNTPYGGKQGTFGPCAIGYAQVGLASW
ncbi:hypothetical protein, partial [Aeromonas caviae]|uniref:hypothetical protein n=1 Tax=Aeromonas caviae TaxID=648 RepID=UPI001CC66BF1